MSFEWSFFQWLPSENWKNYHVMNFSIYFKIQVYFVYSNLNVKILYIKATVVVSVCYRVVCSAQPYHSFYGRTVWASKGGAGVGVGGGVGGEGVGGGQGGFFFFFSPPKLPRPFYGFKDRNLKTFRTWFSVSKTKTWKLLGRDFQDVGSQFWDLDFTQGLHSGLRPRAPTSCMLMILKPRPLLMENFNNFVNFEWFFFFYHNNMTRFCGVTHNYKMSKTGFEPSHPQQRFALTIPPPMVRNNIITKNPWKFKIINNYFTSCEISFVT
jgi:hypothetical protein